MPERESGGASGAGGRPGPGTTTPGDWLLSIGGLYALAAVPTALFLLSRGAPLGLLLEGHLGLLLLGRIGWYGWPWFLAPCGIVGLLLPIVRKRRRPILCGLLVAFWLVEGVLLAFLGGLTV